MEEQKKQQEKKQADPKIEDLPSKVTPETAENVKGGAARRGGDDDDLEELQVQR